MNDNRRFLLFGLNSSVPLKEQSIDYYEGSYPSAYTVPFTNGIFKFDNTKASSLTYYLYANDTTTFDSIVADLDFAMFMIVSVSQSGYTVFFHGANRGSSGALYQTGYNGSDGYMIYPSYGSNGRCYFTPGYGYDTAHSNNTGPTPSLTEYSYGSVSYRGAGWYGSAPIGIYIIVITKSQMAEIYAGLKNQITS